MSNDALTLIREESDRLATVLTATDPDRHVPSCPAWTAADLLWHLTEVHEFWGAILATGALTDEQAGSVEEQIAPRPEDVAQLCERRAAATDLLLGQLARRSDDEPAWFWFAADRTVGIIRRMQTHEATIHRVDAELAAEAPVTRIAPSVALAGLQHMIEVMWPAQLDWVPDWAETTPVARADLAPDGQEPVTVLISRWRGTRPRDGRSLDVPVAQPMPQERRSPATGEREAGTVGARGAGSLRELPAAEVTGTAQALNLWAWGRSLALETVAGATPPMRITGDDRAVAELAALIDEGIG